MYVIDVQCRTISTEVKERLVHSFLETLAQFVLLEEVAAAKLSSNYCWKGLAL